MSENIIEVKNVKKYFKQVKAVDNLSLNVKRGEYLALLGPNGAGKTTLVEMIEGLQKPDTGDISILNTNWRKNKKFLHHSIGISLQETRFIDKLTTYETLRLFASFYNLPSERIIEVLQLIRLEDKQKALVVNLSGGQRQRLALGIALLNSPKILMLDEPTTGLDPNSRRELWDILLNLKKQGDTTLILTTHYMEEAAVLCENIVIMDKGTILAQGSLENLLNTHNTGEIIEYGLHTEMSCEKPNFAADKGVINETWDENSGKGQIIVDDIVSSMPPILDRLRDCDGQLRSFECRKMTLDDLFVSMTGRRLND